MRESVQHSIPPAAREPARPLAWRTAFAAFHLLGIRRRRPHRATPIMYRQDAHVAGQDMESAGIRIVSDAGNLGGSIS